MPADRIELRGLRLLGVHGLLDEEERPQPFEVDLDLVLDTAPAAAGDDLDATVDYAAVCQAVAAVLAGPRRQLLETLAHQVADRVLAWPAVAEVAVTVRKLRPPVPYDLASVGVRVVRRR